MLSGKLNSTLSTQAIGKSFILVNIKKVLTIGEQMFKKGNDMDMPNSFEIDQSMPELYRYTEIKKAILIHIRFFLILVVLDFV